MRWLVLVFAIGCGPQPVEHTDFAATQVVAEGYGVVAYDGTDLRYFDYLRDPDGLHLLTGDDLRVLETADPRDTVAVVAPDDEQVHLFQLAPSEEHRVYDVGLRPGWATLSWDQVVVTSSDGTRARWFDAQGDLVQEIVFHCNGEPVRVMDPVMDRDRTLWARIDHGVLRVSPGEDPYLGPPDRITCHPSRAFDLVAAPRNEDHPPLFGRRGDRLFGTFDPETGWSLRHAHQPVRDLDPLHDDDPVLLLGSGRRVQYHDLGAETDRFGVLPRAYEQITTGRGLLVASDGERIDTYEPAFVFPARD